MDLEEMVENLEAAEEARRTWMDMIMDKIKEIKDGTT